VSQFVSAFMLLCLALVQAHNFVPHHHHEEAAAAHRHTADHRWGFGAEADHDAQLECPHPAFVPHQEQDLGQVVPPVVGFDDIPIAALEASRFFLAGRSPQSKVEIGRAELPYATGPPGIASTRAPPLSSVA
jgi:hypothetical protein